jgi:hypothetical protein
MNFDLVGKERETLDKALENIQKEIITLDAQINFDKVRGRLDEFSHYHKKKLEEINNDMKEIKKRFNNKAIFCMEHLDRIDMLLNPEG